MLIKFLTGSFRALVGLAAWGILVLGTAIGAIAGIALNNGLLQGDKGFLPIVVAVVGFLLAFIVEVVVIPPFMILFTIDARVKFIENKLKDQNNP